MLFTLLSKSSTGGIRTPVASPTRAGRVLLAQQDASFRQLLVRYLQQRGYWVTPTAQSTELVDELTDLLIEQESSFDAVISDLHMLGTVGVLALEAMRSAGSSLAVILVAAHPSSETTALAARLGAVVLVKPFRLEVLTEALAVAPLSSNLLEPR